MELFLDGNIDSEMFHKLLTTFNEMPQGETLNIWISSNGGNVDIAEAMICFINRNADRITLTSLFSLESSAFFLFFNVICPREILDSTIGMIHLKIWAGEIKEGNIEPSRTKHVRRHMRESLMESIKFYKSLGISEEDIEKLKNGEEIFYGKKRLEAMLKRHCEKHSK